MHKAIIFALGGLVGAAAGGAIGWFWCKHHYKVDKFESTEKELMDVISTLHRQMKLQDGIIGMLSEKYGFDIEYADDFDLDLVDDHPVEALVTLCTDETYGEDPEHTYISRDYEGEVHRYTSEASLKEVGEKSEEDLAEEEHPEDDDQDDYDHEAEMNVFERQELLKIKPTPEFIPYSVMEEDRFYDTEELIYYREDNVLINQEEEPVDIHYMIGTKNLDLYLENPDRVPYYYAENQFIVRNYYMSTDYIVNVRDASYKATYYPDLD